MKKNLIMYFLLLSFMILNHSCHYPYFQVNDTSHIKLLKSNQIKKYTDTINESNKSIFIKNVPEKYKLLFSIVCEKYQELKNENITFKSKKIKTTMQTRPVNVLGKRKYKIWINNNKKFKGIKFEDIPFNAQIGIIAHEMAHILDYKYKSNNEVFMTLRKFTTKSGRRLYERTIDSLTVVKGFGYQLKDWAQYAMYDSKATEEYKEFKKQYYMKPVEIDSLLNIELKQYDNH